MLKRFQNLPLLRISPALLFLTGTLLVIHLISSYIVLSSGSNEFFRYFGLSPESITSGKIWTLITYAFFHHPQNHWHVVLNIFMLVYYGGRISHIFGVSKALQLTGLGVMAGGLCQLSYAVICRENTMLIGASGGAFALLAAHLIFVGETRFFGIKGALLVPLLTILTIFMLFIPLARVGFLFQVSHACHLGGLILGWFCAWKMLRIAPFQKKM